MKKKIRFQAMVVIMLALSISLIGAVCEDGGDDSSSLMLLMGSGLTVTKTSYNTSDVVTGAERTVYFSKSAYKRDTLILSTLGVIQDWNIKSRKNSTGAGADSKWLTGDDTYDEWIAATMDGNFVNLLEYDPSDKTTITGRRLFTVNDTYQLKLMVYGGPGGDSQWNTNDDTITSASGAWSRTFIYDTSSRYERRKSYTGDQEVFQYSQVFVYNFDGTLNAMRRFSNLGETVLVDGFTFDYYSDRTVAKLINSSETTIAALTFVDIGSSQVKVFQSSGDGTDNIWGTDDDNLNPGGNVKIYTIKSGLITRENIYNNTGTTLIGYVIYSNQ